MPRQRTPIWEFNGPGERIIDFLARYHYLTVPQAHSLLGYRTYKYTHSQLKRLVDGGYCYKDTIPRKEPGDPGVWSLTPKGQRYLQSQGVVTLPKESHAGERWNHNHTLTINDWMIALELFCRRNRDFDLMAMQHDLLLKRLMPRIPRPGGGTFRSIPDAFVEVWQGHRHIPVWLELDLSGKEQESAWKQKIRGILAFYDGGHYRDMFHTDYITIAVPVMTTSYRRSILMQWTEDVLHSAGREAWGEFFLFSELDFRNIDPCEYFTTPHWQVPFSRSLEALL